MNDNSVKGTKFKLNINMTPIDGQTMASVKWDVLVFTEMGYKSITISKDEAIKVDDNNYIITVDSAVCGAGKYYVTLTAYIPDTDFKDGVRLERRTTFSGVTIDSK